MIQQQRGITLIGFLVVASLLVFAVFIGMRLFPIYSEYFSVVQAVNGVKAEPGVESWTPAQVRSAMEKRFDVSYVANVDPRRDIIINRDAGGYNLIVKYEVRKPLLGNLDVVAMFDKRVNLLEP